jgi:hypothetical protein
MQRFWRWANSPAGRWMAVCIWAMVIFGFSSWPSPPEIGSLLENLVVKKSAHFVEFGILAVLLVRALERANPVPTVQATIGALSLVAGWAALDELHQSFTPGRFPLLTDVLIDISGAILFLWGWRWFHQNIAK